MKEKDSRSMSEVIDSPDFDKAMGNFMRMNVNAIVSKESRYPAVVRKWIIYAVQLVYNSIIVGKDEK